MNEPEHSAYATDAALFADALKALGHPHRLSMLRQLARRDRCCTGDFCECLPLAQSTISQHLEMLRNAGLVESRASGTRTVMKLDRKALHAIAEQLSKIADTSCCE